MEHIDVSNQPLAAQRAEIYRFVIRTADLKDPVYGLKLRRHLFSDQSFTSSSFTSSSHANSSETLGENDRCARIFLTLRKRSLLRPSEDGT